ncbi:MAG: hypothetical protein HOP18_01905 [Deltaproteobacteria bacterium]|nr:hypothetical protein [Deltaproteobacteria bacterium]
MHSLRRKILTAISVIILGVVSVPPASAQTLTRVPYLQSGTPNSIVVRWRTSTAVVGVVRYGTTQGSLTLQAAETSARTEHEVKLIGLSPNTKYFYSVGHTTVTLAGNDATHFFLTSPPIGTAKATRVWVLGDAGTKDANQAAVRNAYTTFAGTRYTDLWLMLGDNAYETGTDAEFQAAVFNMYPNFLRQSVLWPTLGNHDGASADSATQTGPYYNIFTLPKNAEAGGVASGTEAYYSFDYGSIHFICLDSFETSRSATGPMANWLRLDLADTTQDWIIAFFHHPPYTKGSHNSDTETELLQMRQNILPILEAGGVDLVLTGHSHSYERSFLLDGHYGLSSTLTAAMKINSGSGRGATPYKKALSSGKGAVYAVAGSSGKIGGGTLNHPAMCISLNNLGSMVLDINNNRLDARFLRENGTTPDYFTIIKGAPAVSITSPANGARFTAPASITINATASDSDGTVSKVEFFRGVTKLGEDLTSPYSFAWASVPAGSFSLTAVATDNDANKTTSAPVNITVAGPNSPPTVSITSPANGASFLSPASITIQATATDVGGSVAKVEFFRGATKLGEDTTSPYSLTLTNQITGSYALTARATDNLGAVKTSAVVTVTVTGNAPPSVRITSPVNNAAFPPPASITIQATASDLDGTVSKVEFFRGTTKIGEDLTSPYAFTWSGVPLGTYALTARATDNQGGTKTATAVTIIVTNTTTTRNLLVNRVYDNKTAKSYYTGGSNGADPMNDLNTTAEEYKFEIESGPTLWWEILYQDPPATIGTITKVVARLDYRPEATWTGTLTAQYINGTTVLKSVTLPVNGTLDPATGKGTKTVYQWDLTSVVPNGTTLTNGKIRIINTSTNGKKVWGTYSVMRATTVGGS